MDSPLLTSVVLALGVLFGFFTLLVESQNPLPPPPPPPVSPPPPPPVSPPPPPPVSPPPPPPVSPPPPPPPVSPPPPPSPRVPPPPPPRARPPPPKKSSHRPNSTQPSENKTPGPDHRLHNDQKHKSPPPSKEKINLGKKIGLLFMGIVVILQVCAVAFLMIKRRQLFKDQDMY